MTAHPVPAGVLAPVATPFDADLAPDADRLAAHGRWLAGHRCGLVVFGTTGEANSLGVDEKISLLDALVERGLDPPSMIAGTGTCALSDTVRLTRHAVAVGCAGVLMLPPFYYKEVSDEGLFRAYAEVIERVGAAGLALYLYHIPPVAQVPIRLNLIERLLGAFPDTVVGIKDSSGDDANTQAILDAFPGFRVFVGSESGLLACLRGGGAGCIAATVNISPAPIRQLFDAWQTPEAAALQASVTDFRQALRRFPLIPALKEILARHTGDPAWKRLRPPLVGLSEPERNALFAELDARAFSMPGLD